MESPLINDMRSPTAPTPPASLPVESHGQHKGVIMVVVFIVILLLLAFWLAGMNLGTRQDGAGNTVTDAATGELVAGFPVELLREQGAAIGASYSIAYSKEGKDMPYALYTSAETYQQNIDGFRALLEEQGWTIQKYASPSEIPVTNYYAVKDGAETNIVFAYEPEGSVSVRISYLTVTQ